MKRYDRLSGTSMATPNTAGVVAMIKSVFPSFTPAQIREKLESSADDLGNPGFDEKFGHGRVNLFKAVSY